MASIYDIAKITSGDPLRAASEAGREASTLFAQYEHQKEIIDEINKAIKDAERKSRKNKFGFGVGGSILGGLLGTALTSVLGPAAPYVGAALGAGGAEKVRQDIKKPTEKLEKLKKKLKGRKQAKDVAQTTEAFEQGLDDMVLGDAITAAISAGIMPGALEKGKEALGLEVAGETLIPDDIVNVGQGEIGETLASDLDTGLNLDLERMANYQNEFGQYITPGEDVHARIANQGYVLDEAMGGYYRAPGEGTIEDFIPINKGGERITQEGYSAQNIYPDPLTYGSPGYSIETQAPTDDVLKIFGMKSKEGDNLGQGQDILSALTGLNLNKMPWVGEALQNPWVVNLGRAFGPSIYNELFKSKPVFDEYAQPQFRNPFRGGY